MLKCNECSYCSSFSLKNNKCPFFMNGIENEEISTIKHLSHKEEAYALYLATCLLYGESISKNEKKAISILKKLAKLEYAPANYILSLCYFDGLGVVKEHEIAVELCKKAAEQGCIPAEAKLYRCYLNGIGVKKDLEQAIYWCARAVDNRYAELYYDYAELCAFEESSAFDLETACKYFELALENGKEDVGERLKELFYKCAEKHYLLRDSIKSHISMACKYYEKALKYGSKLAYDKLVELHKNYLEDCYEDTFAFANQYDYMSKGDFCLNNKYAPNVNIALHYYLTALQSITNTSSESETNTIITPKPLKQVCVFGVDNTISQLQERINNCHLLILSNSDNAAKTIYEEALSGDQKAQYDLATLFESEEFELHSFTEAVKWYRLSAEQGNSDAQYMLGRCYNFGIGVERNSDEAIKWYRLSAEQGNEMAQNKLGSNRMKQKWYCSGDVVAKRAAEILENIVKLPIGTFEAMGAYRVEDTGHDGSALPCERTLLIQIYKIYDFNDPEKTGRKNNESMGSYISANGAQVSFAIVPMFYKGADSKYKEYCYEKYDSIDISEYDDVFDVELRILESDYPVSISTLAQSEFFRQEKEFSNSYLMLKSDGTFGEVKRAWYDRLHKNALETFSNELF